MINIFITFLYYINKIDVDIMIRSLEALIKSLNYFNNKYKLYVFTNISDLHNHINDNIKEHIEINVRQISDMTNYYNNIWLNLSFYKIIIYKEIMNAINVTPIWIDLDTIICRNIDHLVNYNNFFIIHGSKDKRQFGITNTLSVPISEYIQGNIWKINKTLLNKLLYIWDNLTIKPYYDFQGLLNLSYHYIKDFKNEMIILGRDVDIDTINGLELYNREIINEPITTHIKYRLKMINNNIIDTYDYKYIQFMSFTFNRLSEWLKNNNLIEIEDNNIIDFFKYCNLIR
jgi:hypothetical protein